MRVLITGGTGFIGSRLALACMERGDDVRIFGQTNTPAEQANKQYLEAKGAQFVYGSMTERSKLDEITKNIDTVFHLAAAQHEANVPDQHFRDVNISGTRNLLESCLDKGIHRFVHGSTIGVYGSLDGRITEDSPCVPDNIYGITKLEGEKVVLQYRDRLPVVVIRICETYGPGDRRLLKLFRGIRKNMFFMIGRGENLHHLVFIEDLIQGFLLAAEKEEAKGEIFLLADNTPITSNEMAKTIANSLGVPPPKLKLPLWPFWTMAILMEKTLQPLGVQPPLHRRRMNFFIKSFSLDNSKAKRLLGFSPRFDFARGVAKTREWYIQEGLLPGTTSGATASGPEAPQKLPPTTFPTTAITEPFDSFWEAPSDIEKGYGKFGEFYRHNYLHHIPRDKGSNILVLSCGPGYLVNLLTSEGYTAVRGIDAFAEKIAYAHRRELPCETARAFDFLEKHPDSFDCIFAEQEINHLTKTEILHFLKKAHGALKKGGTLIVHSLNGANPLTGAEALAQNFDHYNTFTDYSLKQVLAYSGFSDIRVFPLKLYVFYNNPLNYIGIALDAALSALFRAGFIFYGKKNKFFTKKIGAVAIKA